jgi:hypothetical protein
MSALGRANQNASNPRGVSFGSVLGGNINACFYIQVALILPAKWEQEADLWADADRVTLEIAELCFRATSNALVRRRRWILRRGRRKTQLSPRETHLRLIFKERPSSEATAIYTTLARIM